MTSKGTPIRPVRVPGHLWAAALKKAAENDDTVSDVLRRALLAYVEDGPPEAQG